ncbi:MAG: DUF4384 domain-containing protein [Acidobacteria bacterium]|nr:DUF4384 domain-containing protein [Acidobacteriota bacterium]
MRTKFKRFLKIRFLTSLVVVSLSCAVLVTIYCFLTQARTVTAQGREGFGLVWEKSQNITRPPTPKRPRPKPTTAPLLTLRWQFQMAGAQTKGEAINPTTRTFVDGELIRIAVQVNQNGFVYLINHTVKSDKEIEGPVLLPGGKYSVKKDQEIVLPPTPLSECPAENQKDGKCWLRTEPPAGIEVVTIIFSRDEIDEWANLSTAIKNPVAEPLINELTRKCPNPSRAVWTEAVQKNSKLKGIRGPHVKMVWNPNKNDNELLVERIEFNHK